MLVIENLMVGINLKNILKYGMPELIVSGGASGALGKDSQDTHVNYVSRVEEIWKICRNQKEY